MKIYIQHLAYLGWRSLGHGHPLRLNFVDSFPDVSVAPLHDSMGDHFVDSFPDVSVAPLHDAMGDQACPSWPPFCEIIDTPLSTHILITRRTSRYSIPCAPSRQHHSTWKTSQLNKDCLMRKKLVTTIIM